MNNLSDIPFIKDNKAWYFLSVFYAHENWSEIVSKINLFRKERKDKFCACLISLSDEKGEHVEISISLPVVQGNMKDEIEQFFLSFLKEFPSVCKKVFPYGKAVWCNYPNNTLLWSRFRIIDLSGIYSDFHQLSFEYAMSLIENDTSPDTLFSACLYLITKGLFCIEHRKQKTLLCNTLDELSIDFKNFSHQNAVRELIDERIDLQEICLTIDLYRDENEFSPELKEWIKSAKELINSYNFTFFCSSICTMLGLKGLQTLAIVELINIWYNRQ